jgi:conjugal transfer ATP-binding protein TraC
MPSIRSLGLLEELKEAFKNIFTSKKPKESLKDLFKADFFADELPYLHFDDQHEIFVNQKSLGFTLEIQPPIGISDSLSRELDMIFEEILEEGDSIQVCLLADHRIFPLIKQWQNISNQESELYQTLTQKTADYFLSLSSVLPKNFRVLFSYSQSDKSKAGIEKIANKKNKISKTLNLSMPVYSWQPEDLMSHIQSFSGFNGSKKVPKKKWDQLAFINTQLKNKQGLMKVSEDHIEFSNEEKNSDTYLLKSFEVTDFPDQHHWSIMQDLLGSPLRDSLRVQHPFYIQYAIHCPSQTKALTQFEKRAYLVSQQGRFANLRRMIPTLEEELLDINLVRKNLGYKSKLIFAQLSVGLWAPQEKMLLAEQTLLSLFASKDMQLTPIRYFQLPQFLSSLPMTWAEYIKDLHGFGSLRTTHNQECKHLIPLTAEWKGTPTPGMLLMGRKGQLLNWNPFDNPSGNYNVTVIGRSGAGKSVFMQHLLISGLRTGAKVFVFDVGRSFEKMCQVCEGQFIEFSKDSKICLNPFSHIPLDDEDQIEASLSLIKPIICSMTSPLKGVSEHENGLIPKAIKSVWQQKKNKATITDVAEWLEAQNDPIAKSLGVRLHPYTREGSYAKFFEGENNIDLHKKMVVIELEELKEKKELQSVILQFFIMNITNLAFLGDRQTPFYICIDEAWDLLRGKETGDFIQTLARRLRKYNGSLVVGSQNIDDFFSSPAAAAAFENSDWMCALSIKVDAIHALAEKKRFIVSESHRKALESLTKIDGQYSEVMICDVNSRFFITRLYLDPFSQLLYSSKPQDFSRINFLRQKGLSVSQTIEHMITENEKMAKEKVKG